MFWLFSCNILVSSASSFAEIALLFVVLAFSNTVLALAIAFTIKGG
jgi:hypothetical protein